MARQLGRVPRGLTAVARACPWGFPAVVESGPYLEDGTPFPTLLYLCCPSAVRAVSRLEAHGGVEAFRRRTAAEPRLARALRELEARYQARRRELAGPDVSAALDGGAVLERGIGGPAGALRASCLHAYAAALLAASAGRLPPPGASSDRPTDPQKPGPVGSPEPAWGELLDGLGALWCGDCRCLASEGGPDPAGTPGTVRRAAVDLGTNSVRLLVADMVCGRPEVLERRARVTRLGESLETTGRLSSAARDRTAAVVADHVAAARALGARSITLVGTSACRDAVDGRDFVAELGRRFDIDAHVIPGELEAVLAYTGATMDLAGDTVLLDIGGGSTELVRRPPDADLAVVSLRMGSVRGTERWFGSDVPSPEEREEARLSVHGLVAPLRPVYGVAADRRLVGVAGTVTTIACLALGLERYDAEILHRSTVSRVGLGQQVDRLAAMTSRERLALPCMQEGREGVIVAGGEVLLGTMEALGFEELTVSERDLLDGILLAIDRGGLAG